MESIMFAAEYQIVVYKPNETVPELVHVDGPKADTFKSVCADVRKSKMLYYTRYGTA